MPTVPCYHAPVIRRLFALSLALLAFAAACGGGSNSGSPSGNATLTVATPTHQPQACAQTQPHAIGDVDGSITVAGVSRTYHLHIPPGYDGATPTPLLLVLHGAGQTGKDMVDYTAFARLADERRFIVVAPNAAGSPPQWNAAKFTGSPNDVTFTRDLVARVDADLCIDADRVFVAGYGMGGGMSRLLACDLGDRIAAIGVVAATNVACTADTPMIVFHGTVDPLVPFEGAPASAQSGGISFPPVRRTASEWSRALGCDGLPTISRVAASVELSTFSRCKRGDGDVLLYTLLGGGSTWPGSIPVPDTTAGPTNPDIDATATMWEFFTAHPLAH